MHNCPLNLGLLANELPPNHQQIPHQIDKPYFLDKHKVISTPTGKLVPICLKAVPPSKRPTWAEPFLYLVTKSGGADMSLPF
jgi:hypothetical protein